MLQELKHEASITETRKNAAAKRCRATNAFLQFISRQVTLIMARFMPLIMSGGALVHWPSPTEELSPFVRFLR